jgi:hypothetical protein
VPRLLFRIALFLSSYAPLFGLLAYENRRSSCTWRILVAVAVIGVVGLVVVLWETRRERGPRLVVEHSRPKDGDVLAYTATYLVPFFSIDLSNGDQVIIFSSFLVVLGIVYVNSDMIFVNPLLSIAGFHSFEITDPQGHTYSLIARRRDLDPGVTIHPAQINRYLRLEVRRERPPDT